MSSKKTYNYKVNNKIQNDTLRVINLPDGPKVLSTKEAIKIADEMNLDLIVINENQNPPIAKIEDYQKFIYNINKNNKLKAKKESKNDIKEIRLTADISSNDLNVKIKKSIELLQDDYKIRCVLKLKGRQNQTPERGELVVLKYLKALLPYATTEGLPKLDNDKWSFIMKSKNEIQFNIS
jgi:translation initiation factor IF-3